MGGFGVRWARAGMAVAAIGCLTIGMGSAVAGANTPVKPNPDTLTLPFQVGDDCGNPEGPTIGQVTVTRAPLNTHTGDRMRIHMVLTGAKPHTNYPMELWLSWWDECEPYAWLGSIHTNNIGGGVGNFTVPVSDWAFSFFIGATTGNGSTDTWSETSSFCLFGTTPPI
jgi:hypothetical protein